MASRWTPVWGNSGNTPTLHLQLTTYCYVSFGDEVDPFESPSRNTIRSVIGPRTADIAGSCLLSREAIGRINDHIVQYYIAGEAKYFDIIAKDIPRITQFSTQLVYINPSNIQDTVGNTFGPHNCADDDCPK
jgi:hypothetical protein